MYILKILCYIALFCITIVGLYYLVRLAVADQVKYTIETTMREELYQQELKWNVYYNDPYALR